MAYKVHRTSYEEKIQDSETNMGSGVRPGLELLPAAWFLANPIFSLASVSLCVKYSNDVQIRLNKKYMTHEKN